MAKDIINIPFYHNFKFYCLEFDAELFHNRRAIFWPNPLTYFWEKLYQKYFNNEAVDNLRYLVDYTINYPLCGFKSFGVTFLNEETPQFRNSRLEYSKEDILINRTSFDNKGRYVYKEHDFQNTVGKLVTNGCNQEWAEDIVRCVNNDEREILKCIAGRLNGKEWSFLKSYFLTDDYIRQRLYNQGLRGNQINYDLMEAESLIIQTNRKLKNAKI